MGATLIDVSDDLVVDALELAVALRPPGLADHRIVRLGSRDILVIVKVEKARRRSPVVFAATR